MSDDTIINLVKKGDVIDLTKKAPNVTRYYVGMGWEAGKGYDLDVSVFPCTTDSAGVAKLLSPPWFIFYNQLESPNGDNAIIHSKDNLDGTDVAGQLDDEYIVVDTSKLPAEVNQVDFIVTINDAPGNGQKFGGVNNAYIKIDELKNFTKTYDVENEPVLNDVVLGQNFGKFNLGQDASEASAVHFGSLTKDPASGRWSFEAVGDGWPGVDLNAVIHQYMPNAKTKTS